MIKCLLKDIRNPVFWISSADENFLHLYILDILICLYKSYDNSAHVLDCFVVVLSFLSKTDPDRSQKEKTCIPSSLSKEA